jgi:hypothetical protein
LSAVERQIVGGLFIIGWNIVWTSLILLFIKYVMRIPLRMTEEQLKIGDDAIHGVSISRFETCINLSFLKQEEAYFFHDDVPEEEVDSAEPGQTNESNGEDEKP